MDLPRWIRTPAELEALARSLAGAGSLTIDTEADSLHHYPGKLCLVQIADDAGRAHLVDPLALPTLAPLGPLLADPRIVKVFHASDNDLAYLKRLYGFTVVSLFDTGVAARFLGAKALGLDGLLREYLGVEPVKSRQKDDWSRRPLTAEQEAYALAAARPHTLEEVLAVPRCSSRVVQRVGGAILEAVARGEALPEAGLPSRQRVPRPHVAAATRRRADALRAWRTKAAHELGLDPGVLFPQRLIDRLAAEPPRDLAQLEQVDGVRRWRGGAFGRRGFQGVGAPRRLHFPAGAEG